MYFHEILHRLNDLRKIWKDQDFKFTSDQKAEFEMLQELRRARVNYFYENGMVATPVPRSRTSS
jgi:hypothetical protein